MHNAASIVVTQGATLALQMAHQHQAALDHLTEILCGQNRPSMDDAAAAVISLGAQFQLLVQEIEKLT